VQARRKEEGGRKKEGQRGEHTGFAVEEAW